MLTAEELSILLTSLGVSLRAVLLSLPFAIAAAWALARPSLRGKAVLDAFVHLPLMLPPVLIGFLLLLALGRRAPLGQWLDSTFGVQIAFTTEGAALATAIMTFPLMVRAIRLSFEAADARLFEAAAVLRASPWDRFISLALPMAGPGVLAGAVTAFAAGLGEFGAVITFASNTPETRTLPIAINSLINGSGDYDQAMRLAWISITLALVGFGTAELLQRWSRRRLEG